MLKIKMKFERKNLYCRRVPFSNFPFLTQILLSLLSFGPRPLGPIELLAVMAGVLCLFGAPGYLKFSQVKSNVS